MSASFSLDIPPPNAPPAAGPPVKPVAEPPTPATLPASIPAPAAPAPVLGILIPFFRAQGSHRTMAHFTVPPAPPGASEALIVNPSAVKAEYHSFVFHEDVSIGT